MSRTTCSAVLSAALLVGGTAAGAVLVPPLAPGAEAAGVTTSVRPGTAATALSPGSANSYTYAPPSAIQVGDLEIVAFGVQAENQAVGSPPSGWTTLGSASSGASDPYAARTLVFAHVRAAGDPAGFTWAKVAGNSGGSGYFAMPVLSFAAQGAALPQVAATTAGTTSGVSVIPQRVATRTGGLLVEAVFSRASHYGDPVVAGSATMTQVGQRRNGSSQTLAVFTKPTAGDSVDPTARTVRTRDGHGHDAPAHTGVLLVALAPRSSAPPPPSAPSTLSGLPWQSGIQSDLKSPGEIAQWRGRPNDLVNIWPNRSTWAEVTDPRPSMAQYSSYPARLSIGVAMLPNDESSSFAACAAGSYDDRMRTFAGNLRSTTYPGGNRGDSILRLAWEFNTPADTSSSLGHSRSEPRGDNAGWISCWRRWYTVVKSVAPDVEFNWNPNSDTSSTAIPADSRTGDAAGDVTALWPGDAYVDLVGIDHYNRWPAISNESQWDDHYDGHDYESTRSPRGVGAWLAFAKSHGKKLSFPEWAITYADPAGPGGADDAGNAFWVRRMYRFFSDNAASIDHEVYFDFSGGFGCQFVLWPMPSGCANNQAAAAYASVY